MTAQNQSTQNLIDISILTTAIKNGLIVVVGMSVIVLVLLGVFKPILASVQVVESVTTSISQFLILIIPFIAYIMSGSSVRSIVKDRPLQAIVVSVITTFILFAVISTGHFILKLGTFAPTSSIQMTFVDEDEGIRVESVEAGGAADEAGVQVGDLIIALRRDPIDRSGLMAQVAQAQVDTPLRLRMMRDDEEIQVTVRTVLADASDVAGLLPSLVVAVAVTLIAIIWPAQITPYVILLTILAPLLLGYIWLVIATFSTRTEGILPLDGQGNIGGFTLENWNFLWGGDIVGLNVSIWQITLNSLVIALSMTVIVLLVSSMAGYALSRMDFRGRKLFLSFTLILHGFPAVTLLIPIFFVIANLGRIPIVGEFIGFNKSVGIALVMVAFELPLGVWLMKGFFDGIPWDIERSAMIDGASRWRVYWEILLPQIRPGLLALGIFAFLGGWNAFLIPKTYSTGAGTVNLPVFLSQLIDETAPVNWNQVAAVGLFQLIPVFVIFIFAQEYLLNIYAGGTKGSS